MEATIQLEDGQTKTIELTQDLSQLLQELANERLTDGMLADRIRNLDTSADAKLLLTKIGNQVVKIGDQVYKVGKKVLEIIFMIASEYPNTLFGLVVGVIISGLISSIPLLGLLLGPLVGPIAIVFGLATGYWNDLRDKRLKQAVQETVAMFGALRTHENESH